MTWDIRNRFYLKVNASLKISMSNNYTICVLSCKLSTQWLVDVQESYTIYVSTKLIVYIRKANNIQGAYRNT